MPFYEYVCPECGAEKEELQKMSDPAPQCDNDGKTMKRQLSVTRTRRGAGLYSLDYDIPPKMEDFK